MSNFTDNPFALDKLRNTLIRLEDTIIFGKTSNTWQQQQQQLGLLTYIRHMDLSICSTDRASPIRIE